MPDEKKFYLGFASAGAISAGAYSAGVLDFLIYALDEWDKENPECQVILPVFSGASAGSITAAIGVLAASCDNRLVDPDESGQDANAQHYLQVLYDCWVDGPDFTDSPCGALLDLGDLQKNRQITSILNSDRLDAIAGRAFSALATSGKTPRRYFPEQLHIYMTQTNVRGIPYAIKFDGGSDSYYNMLCHADRAHYQLNGLGTASFASAWSSADISASGLSKTLNINAPVAAWSDYQRDALASGAFPLGLEARILSTTSASYDSRMWTFSTGKLTVPVPHWPDNWNKTDAAYTAIDWHKNDYVYTAIDGGMINNHPFEYARYGIMDAARIDNERDIKKADRAVLMVNPFPEPPPFQLDNNDARDNLLPTIARKILPTLINQNRIKPEELLLALDQNTASRWLIAPRRYVADPVNENYSLACALLGGFGGFADRQFREHDYELGRRNCQDFLARWFGMASANPHVSTVQLPQPLNHDARTNLPSDPGKHAVIPLVGGAAEAVSVRDWPKIPLDKVKLITAAAKRRLDKVIPRLLKDNLGGLYYLFAKIAYSIWSFCKLRDFIYYTLLADLVRRDQVSGFERLTGIQPDVLAACMEPAYAYRTEQGVAHDLRRSRQEVAEALAALEAQGLLYKNFFSSECYTYKPRGSNWHFNPDVN